MFYFSYKIIIFRITMSVVVVYDLRNKACSHSLVKTRTNVWDNSRILIDKRSPRFSPSYEGTENMFYFFY